ncbi:sigma-70 family RNA polymerase sigma factor [Rhizobium sp. NTR19]|uniref:RNA polymerase sigma factor n=1 Tax=Neorhizobium turbinariae TaxID=2937795 RepID=A0ABT0ISP7_9HYPH|nr:sigma-70 family RNA polymerase sigma factor [Neorhizobium turbinariae]MCK8780900.1 sigma-70 family RNA polymerase sigma factor [Neorhizobium turbinariae]
MNDAYSNPKVKAELIELIPALRKFARRFHSSPTDVDDLVQDTLLKALANFDKFEEGTRLRSWLFTIMRNSFCTKFGVAKRERVGMDANIAERPAVPPVQEWVVRGHELEHAIARLPEHYRTAIDLIFIQGISYDVAADRCKCPVGTMKSRVNRARQHLAKELS